MIILKGHGLNSYLLGSTYDFVINVTDPTIGTLTAITADDTHTGIIAQLSEGSATVDPVGPSVTITPTLYGVSDPVEAGETATFARFVYEATGAETITRDVAINLTVAAGTATQGSIAFPFSGAARPVGNSWDGSAFIVVPDGETITMLDPTPSVGDEGGSLISGVMINPLKQLTSDTDTELALDERFRYNASNLATFPATLSAGDIVVKAISQPNVIENRQGLIQEYAVCHIVSEIPASNMLAPTPWGWAGRTNFDWRPVDMAAIEAMRPTYSTAGHTVPDLTDLYARTARFNPGLIASDGAGSGGYQSTSLYNYGDDYSNNPDGNYNYGPALAENFRGVITAWLSDLTDVGIDPAMRRMIALGSWHFDTQEGVSDPKDGDGGHWQFMTAPLALGLYATGRAARISELPVISPENQLSQSFTFTPELVARCVPHNSDLDPFTYRERAIQQIANGFIYVDFNTTGSPYWLTMDYMRVVRAADGFFETLAEDETHKRTNPDQSTVEFPQTLTTRSDFGGLVPIKVADTSQYTIGDVIHLAPDYTINVGDRAWTIESADIFGSFNPGVGATYRSINTWAAEMMLMKATLLNASGVYDAAIGVVYEGNEGTKGMPDHFNYYATDLGNTWVEEMWNSHHVAMGFSAENNSPININLLGQSQLYRGVNNGYGVASGIPVTNTPSGIVSVVEAPLNGINADVGNEPARFDVSQATFDSGDVGSIPAVFAGWMEDILPGRKLNLNDSTVGGTGRGELWDDDEEDDRSLLAYKGNVDFFISEFGQFSATVECWQGNDNGSAKRMPEEFFPGLYGWQYTNDVIHPLGTANPEAIQYSGEIIVQSLWDLDAPLNQEGRGIHPKSVKHIAVDWWSFGSGGTDAAPWLGFTTDDQGATAGGYASTLNDARRSYELMFDDPRLADFALPMTGSNHMAAMGGDGHQEETSPYGLMLAQVGTFLAIMKVGGIDVQNPRIVDIEGPTDGTYVDVLATLPNGGDLTTYRALEGVTDGTDSPYKQPVTGFEVTQAGLKRPIFKSSETSYPVEYRGSVVIQSASEIHATHGRVGRVRITPDTPFPYGSTISYLQGDGGGILAEPRDPDALMNLDFLLEHVPAWYNAARDYPFCGAPVFVQPPALTVPTAAPAFVAQAVDFTGASIVSSAVSVPAGSNFTFSMWMRNADTAWHANSFRLMDFRVGTSDAFGFLSSSAGRMSMRLRDSNSNAGHAFYAAQPGNVGFAVDQWYHIAVSFDGTTVTVYVDGLQVKQSATGTPNFANVGFQRAAIGASMGGGTDFVGDIGHLYFNTYEYLDLSVPANMARLLNGNVPADMGPDGNLVTGTIPQFYCDGVGDAWNNKGAYGPLPLSGSLGVSTSPTLV